ncbi:anti-sigma regulatory factor [Aeromonas diversa]|uniref:anti-sigma regulatory factor n=1 Tax=Aeromonas diversa TaxID=502790 RepID=UPI003462C151
MREVECYRLDLETDIAIAVMGSYTYARTCGLAPQQMSEVATTVSELATNVIKYASDGEVWIEHLLLGAREGVRVTVIDRGPGIADLDNALRDHFSTGQSLGLGLPGVQRLMDEFTIDTSSGGTRVAAIKWRA